MFTQPRIARPTTLMCSFVALLALGACTQTVQAPEVSPDVPTLHTTDVAYGPKDLGTLAGGYESQALATNADGSVVVGYSTTDGHNFELAFRWTNEGRMEDLGTLPGYITSRATHVSDSGSVIVGYSQSDDEQSAFRWTAAGGMENLGTLPGKQYIQPSAINPDGSVIVGTASTFGEQSAFRWTAAGGMEDLGTLPGWKDFWPRAVSADGSVVVLTARGVSDEFGQRAFRWTVAGGLEDLGTLPGGGNSVASDVSADGTVIVGHSDASGGIYAVRWTTAGIEALGNGDAHIVSADGSVVVGNTSTSGYNQAFRWTAESGMQGLNNGFGGNYSGATDASADGSVVVGRAEDARGRMLGFRWTAAGGMQELASLPANDSGDSTYSGDVTAVSADGSVVVGRGAAYSVEPDGNRLLSDHAFRWTLQTDYDDGDGIESSIDGAFDNNIFYDESKRNTSYFTDQHKGGTTVGRIFENVYNYDITSTVTDLAEAQGVRLSAQGGNASESVEVQLCFQFAVVLTTGDAVNVTCGSLLAEVLSGSVDIALSNGAVVSVPQDATAFMNEQTDGNFTVENRSGSQNITITFEGRTRTVAPGESADAEPQEQIDSYTITFDGVPTGRVISNVKLNSGVISSTGTNTDSVGVYARRSDKNGNVALVTSRRDLIISKDGRSQTSYAKGGNIFFRFTEFGSGRVAVDTLKVAGVTATGGFVEVYDRGTRVKRVTVPKTGSSGSAVLAIDAENISAVGVYLKGVGRVDNLTFASAAE